jgi:hypothetical protein
MQLSADFYLQGERLVETFIAHDLSLVGDTQPARLTVIHPDYVGNSRGLPQTDLVWIRYQPHAHIHLHYNILVAYRRLISFGSGVFEARKSFGHKHLNGC